MDAKKHQEIQKQAKEILDKFAASLEKVKAKEEDFYVEGGEFEREEKEGKDSPEGFKNAMLSNAPRHDDNFIIAEKGEWK